MRKYFFFFLEGDCDPRVWIYDDSTFRQATSGPGKITYISEPFIAEDYLDAKKKAQDILTNLNWSYNSMYGWSKPLRNRFQRLLDE